MMIKRWKPFWSYDVERTEGWLSEMAVEGKELVGLNRLMRVFLFEEGVERERTEYQIVYDKSPSVLPNVLLKSGWESALSEGNWKFIKNQMDAVRTYPDRDGILKRNRLHTNVLKGVSAWYAVQLVMPIILLLTILFQGFEEANIVPSPFWILTILYFIQVIGVICLTIYATRKLRAFERKFFSIEIDESKQVGETFAKWKPNWMYSPDLVENWLSDMSAEGNHLVRVWATRFTFERGLPKRVSYVCDTQFRTSPNYFDIHKSAGWQLRSTLPYLLTKYSFWVKGYDERDMKPQFTYDAVEKGMQVRKILLGSVIQLTLLIFIMLLTSRANLSLYQEYGWTPIRLFYVGVLIIIFIIFCSSVIRTIKYALRMRKV